MCAQFLLSTVKTQRNAISAMGAHFPGLIWKWCVPVNTKYILYICVSSFCPLISFSIHWENISCHIKQKLNWLPSTVIKKELFPPFQFIQISWWTFSTSSIFASVWVVNPKKYDNYRFSAGELIIAGRIFRRIYFNFITWTDCPNLLHFICVAPRDLPVPLVGQCSISNFSTLCTITWCWFVIMPTL